MRDDIGEIVDEHFGGTICDDLSDNTAGNAFKHALWMCLIATDCDVAAAEGLGDSHENFTGNTCDIYSMDLHNNQVGIELSQDSGDCVQKVLQALQDGQLRFYPDGSAACGGLESEYNASEHCPQQGP